jgi:hypothetical protein
MDNFVIESANKKILVNNVELNLLFDDHEFEDKLFQISDILKNSDGKKNSEISSEVAEAIDNMFGESTCHNIFGCDKPSSFLLIELLNYISSFVEEFKNKRLEKINEKYGAERLGEDDV